MSDVFTASNGTKIETSEKYGGLEVTSSEDFDYLRQKHVDALREWFQAERDEELGWWRASPGFVVKPRASHHVIGSRSVNVLNERLGITKPVWEVEESRSEYGIAARLYFDAHPEPKSWLEAKPGEVWVLTMEGEERPAIVTEDGNFESPLFLVAPGSVRITAGRRIWPPQDGDNDADS